MLLFLRIFSTILAISLLLTGLLYFLRRRFAKTEVGMEHLHSSVFSLFTTIYGFFLGFAIATLWSAFLSAQSNVTREADAVVTAYRISRTLPDSETFRRTLTDYVRSLVQDEWPTMKHASTLDRKTQQYWDKTWEAYIALKPADKSDYDLYLQVGSHLSQASQQRLSRHLATKSNLYPPIWVIIIFGFVTVLYGLYFSHVQQNLVRLIFDGMVIFVVLCCIYFIYDIDTPFSGYVVVTPEVFEIVYARMGALQ
jgi:hypothetical protein